MSAIFIKGARFSRRSILAAGTVALAAPWVARAQNAPAPEKRVVLMIFGGLLGKKIKANVEAFTKPRGIEAVFVESASSEILATVRAQHANPQFDLCLLNNQTFVVARSLGLIEKLNPTLVPNAADLLPDFREADGYGQAYEINPVGFAYRADKFAQAGIPVPDHWRAVLDPRLRGRTITFSLANFYTLLELSGFALSQGKTVNDGDAIWPAVEALHANQTVVVPAPGQAEQMAERGDIWIYPATAERAFLLGQHLPQIAFAVAKDGMLPLVNYMAPVKGAPHPVAAQMVLNWMLGEQIQGTMAQDSAIVPVNRKVVLTPALKQRLGLDPDKPLPRFQHFDVAAVNQLMGDWAERFDKIMAR